MSKYIKLNDKTIIRVKDDSALVTQGEEVSFEQWAMVQSIDVQDSDFVHVGLSEDEQKKWLVIKNLN